MKVLVDLLKDLELAGFSKKVDHAGRIMFETRAARLSIVVENQKIEWSKGYDLENGLMNRMILGYEHRDLPLADQVNLVRDWVESMGIELFEHEA